MQTPCRDDKIDVDTILKEINFPIEAGEHTTIRPQNEVEFNVLPDGESHFEILFPLDNLK